MKSSTVVALVGSLLAHATACLALLCSGTPFAPQRRAEPARLEFVVRSAQPVAAAARPAPVEPAVRAEPVLERFVLAPDAPVVPERESTEPHEQPTRTCWRDASLASFATARVRPRRQQVAVDEVVSSSSEAEAEVENEDANEIEVAVEREPDPEAKPIEKLAAEPASSTPTLVAGSNVPPQYPSIARRRGWQGTATLRIRCDAAGRVTAVHLLQSSGHDVLDRAAIEAVRAWRFRGGPGAIVQPVAFLLGAD